MSSWKSNRERSLSTCSRCVRVMRTPWLIPTNSIGIRLPVNGGRAADRVHVDGTAWYQCPPMPGGDGGSARSATTRRTWPASAGGRRPTPRRGRRANWRASRPKAARRPVMTSAPSSLSRARRWGPCGSPRTAPWGKGRPSSGTSASRPLARQGYGRAAAGRWNPWCAALGYDAIQLHDLRRQRHRPPPLSLDGLRRTDVSMPQTPGVNAAGAGTTIGAFDRPQGGPARRGGQMATDADRFAEMVLARRTCRSTGRATWRPTRRGGWAWRPRWAAAWNCWSASPCFVAIVVAVLGLEVEHQRSAFRPPRPRRSIGAAVADHHLACSSSG